MTPQEPETTTPTDRGLASLAGFAVLGAALALCLAWSWSRFAGLLATTILIVSGVATAGSLLLVRRGRRRGARGGPRAA